MVDVAKELQKLKAMVNQKQTTAIFSNKSNESTKVALGDAELYINEMTRKFSFTRAGVKNPVMVDAKTKSLENVEYINGTKVDDMTGSAQSINKLRDRVDVHDIKINDCETKNIEQDTRLSAIEQGVAGTLINIFKDEPLEISYRYDDTEVGVFKLIFEHELIDDNFKEGQHNLFKLELKNKYSYIIGYIRDENGITWPNSRVSFDGKTIRLEHQQDSTTNEFILYSDALISRTYELTDPRLTNAVNYSVLTEKGICNDDDKVTIKKDLAVNGGIKCKRIDNDLEIAGTITSRKAKSDEVWTKRVFSKDLKTYYEQEIEKAAPTISKMTIHDNLVWIDLNSCDGYANGRRMHVSIDIIEPSGKTTPLVYDYTFEGFDFTQSFEVDISGHWIVYFHYKRTSSTDRIIVKNIAVYDHWTVNCDVKIFEDETTIVPLDGSKGLEIASNIDEPVRIRQYGLNTSRGLVLLDTDGNTTIPGKLTVNNDIDMTKTQSGGSGPNIFMGSVELRTGTNLLNTYINGSIKQSIDSDGVRIRNGDLKIVDGNITFQNNTVGNDFGRIRMMGTTAEDGSLEIATADDGNEPIYVRQYTGKGGEYFGTIKRTLTLLDKDGNTILPGNLYINNSIILKHKSGREIMLYHGWGGDNGGSIALYDTKTQLYKTLYTFNSQTITHVTNVTGEVGTFCEATGNIYDGYDNIGNTDCICAVQQSTTLNKKIVGIICGEKEFASHGDVLVRVPDGFSGEIGDILCPDDNGYGKVATEADLMFMMLHAIPRPKITSLDPGIDGYVACFLV